MTILPKIRTKFGEGVGVEILVSPPDLSDNNQTFLTTDYAAGVSSLAVDNGNKFSANEYIVVGRIGGEKTEIVKISAVAAASLTTDTTDFAHNRGEQITFIPYNQIVIERSTDSGTSYSELATVDIRPDSDKTYYQHSTGASTDYYRARFKNSFATTYSQYSDGLIATGYADNSAGLVIRNALVTLGESIDPVITKEFLFEALHEGRVELDQMNDRWSFRTVFDYDAGDVIPGHNRLTVPTNLRDPATHKNLLAVKIGAEKLPVTYADKRTLNRWYEGVARTTLNGAITTGSTSIVLTSSGDFEESGDIVIAGAAITDTLDTVAYTSNTESTNTLGGVTGIQAAGHASGAIAWQGASFGYPVEYTVDNSEIVFSQPFDDDHAGENIWLDYYKTMTKINSDTDTFDEPNFMIFVPYLRWRMKARRNKELKAEEDSDYKKWIEKRNETVQKEYLGQDLHIEVDVPC